MSDADLRIDPLTGAYVVVTPWRQQRPSRPDGQCPFCPGGLEAPEPYDVRHFPNRWPALPDGCHEVILHSPDHTASFPVLGEEQAARVVELWSARTAALGSRDDVKYVFVFENRGRMIGATIDHPHSQIMAFTMIPPVVEAELSAGKCDLCQGVDDDLVVIRRSGWQAAVPWAPSWPYEMLLSPRSHVPDLPAADPELQAGLGAVLVEALTRMERLLGRDTPYMLWIHQRPTDGSDWPAAHLHLHLMPARRAPGVARHLAAAEVGAVLAEKRRVLRAAELLQAGSREQVTAIGGLLTVSHYSLRDQFGVSWPQADEAVAAAIDAGAAGARMTGGGFGGCVVALVPADRAEEVRGAVTERFTRHRWPARATSTGCLLTAAAARACAAMAELLTATPPTNI